MKKQPLFNPITLAVIAPGLISGVIILLQMGFELLSVALATFIFIASIAVAYMVYQQQHSLLKQIQKVKHALTAQEAREIEKFDKFSNLCQTILPLWQGQIDDVIGQSSDAVNTLAQRFS